MGMDIGPETIELFCREHSRARAPLFGTGPMGVFEFPNFAAGTKAVAKAVAEMRRHLHHRRRRLGGGR